MGVFSPISEFCIMLWSLDKEIVVVACNDLLQVLQRTVLQIVEYITTQSHTSGPPGCANFSVHHIYIWLV